MPSAILSVPIPAKRATAGKPYTAPQEKFGVVLAVPEFVTLSATESAIFADLCKSLPTHMHAQIDAVQVAELSRVIAQMEKCRAHIAKHGSFEVIVMMNGSERRRESPEAKLLNSLSRQRHRLVCDLGIATPARAKLSPAGAGNRRGSDPDRWGA